MSFFSMFYAVQDHQESIPEYIHGGYFLFSFIHHFCEASSHNATRYTQKHGFDSGRHQWMSTVREGGRRKQEVPSAVTLVITVLLLLPSFLSSLILSAITQYPRIYRRDRLISYRQFKLENPCLLKAFLLYRSVVGGWGGLDENGLHSLTDL